MGTWGAGILDSDLALDVKSAYRERVANGAGAEKAVRELVREWREGFDDHEDGGVMWLALADAAWDAGRLTPALKKRALAILRSPSSVEPFAHDARLLEERRRAIGGLEKKLAKKPPAPKRIPRTKKRVTELKEGELLVYTLPSRHKALLWVAKVTEDKGGAIVVLELLDWVKKSVPTDAQLRALKLPARLTRIAYDPWGRMPAWFWAVDLARRVDPGQRYFVWPEKFVPTKKNEKGFGPIVSLGPDLEKAVAWELGIRP
jgi:hypothetical protein